MKLANVKVRSLRDDNRMTFDQFDAFCDKHNLELTYDSPVWKVYSDPKGRDYIMAFHEDRVNWVGTSSDTPVKDFFE